MLAEMLPGPLKPLVGLQDRKTARTATSKAAAQV